MKDNGKIILSLLAGASAGVVAGILMAPEAGEATRDNLKRSASRLGKDLGGKLQAGMGQLQSLSASAGTLMGRSSGSNAKVTNTGSTTTATSHLDSNPTGGNIEASGTRGMTDAGKIAPKARTTAARSPKAKNGGSNGGGSSTGSGGGSNATA